MATPCPPAWLDSSESTAHRWAPSSPHQAQKPLLASPSPSSPPVPPVSGDGEAFLDLVLSLSHLSGFSEVLYTVALTLVSFCAPHRGTEVTLTDMKGVPDGRAGRGVPGWP